MNTEGFLTVLRPGMTCCSFLEGFFHAQKMIIVTSIISEQYGLGVAYYSCVDAQIIFPVLFLGMSKCSHQRSCKRRQSLYNMCVRMCFCCECMHMYAYAFYFNVLKTWAYTVLLTHVPVGLRISAYLFQCIM